ncbi:MAG TPA: 3'-5' exonuclease [Candidatus Kapabacteria bacterium]|nr:3'-5' exonuclease [Candidatus Kapabacteria bacterium]
MSEAVLATSADTSKQNPNAVFIMTLHAAKGLEFPLVLISGCEEGLIPLGFSPDSKDLEEERRLFYVGMTRARQRLILLSASSRFAYGERVDRRESRFLANLDAGDAMEVVVPSIYGATRSYGYEQHDRYSRAQKEQHIAKPKKEPSYEGLAPGVAIMHDSFGPGRIIQITGKGEDAHAIVDFRSVGRKHLMLKFANLHRL